MYHLTKLIWNEQKATEDVPEGYRLIGEANNDKGKFRQLAVHIKKGADTPENICDAINNIIDYFKNR